LISALQGTRVVGHRLKCVQPALFNGAPRLTSVPRRSTEEYVAQDWAAVAKAIDSRLAELGLRQQQLATRAHVSLAIVRELQHNTVERRRSARTLEALSLALEWHPRHLHAVLTGDSPPQRGEVVMVPLDTVAERLAAIEQRLGGIESRLGELTERLSTGGGSGAD
jgi:hypothetical protein